VSFAVHNDPNARSWSRVATIVWPTYNVGSMVLESNDSTIRVVGDSAYDGSERCKFFWENGKHYGSTNP
jgi:archaellum component FlaG (FlaF/FlaG flagellin family)